MTSELDSSPANTILPLFRAEVMNAHARRWEGPIRLARPLASWLSSVAALVIVLSLVAFAIFGSITRKARTSGVLVPMAGSATIAASVTGMITQVHVKEGDSVARGQVLFDLSTERTGKEGELSVLVAQQLAVREASLSSERRLRQHQHRDKMLSIRDRLQSLSREQDQLEQELTMGRRRRDMARATIGKFEALEKNGFVSAIQLQQKQEEFLDVAARLSALERNKSQLGVTCTALAAELSAETSALASDLAQLDRSLASLRQERVENQSRSTTRVVAMVGGTITAMPYQSGHSVSAGQMLATLLPQDQAQSVARSSVLEAHLYVPSRASGFVQAGQKVSLRLDAYPFQKFGMHEGTVIAISQSPFAPGELPPHLASTVLEQLQQTLPTPPAAVPALFRVRIRLERQTMEVYGESRQLKEGMTLNADIKLDHRSIWEWITEPLLAVTRRI